MGSGWFPSRPKGRGKGYYNVITKKDDLKEGEIEEEDVESDPEEDDSDSEEESEEESTDDDEKTIITFITAKKASKYYMPMFHPVSLRCLTS
ncbi:unnamed protein product [Aureobasidium pullulans]|nr:unnamed protein product [Aureobasidium pullulans]